MHPSMIAALRSDGVTIDPSLRLYIPFNEGVGAVAKDYSQYGNNGVLTDVKWGINGGVFNGTSSYVDCGNDPSLDITDAITIDVWVKPDNTVSTVQNIIRRSGSHFALGGGWTSGKWSFWICDGLWHTTGDSVTTIQANNWYHIVGVYDKDGGTNRLKLYVNGLLEVQDTLGGTMVIAAENILIGKQESGFSIAGSIDGVKIYNRALSALEILQHYESEQARYEV